MICHPPLGGNRSIFLRTNLRYGDDDPMQWPQPFTETYPHYACIPQCPDLPNHPHMILWLTPNPRNYMKQPGLFGDLWMLDPVTFHALTKVATEILEHAAKPTLKDHNLILWRVLHVRHLLQWLEYIPTTLQRMQLSVCKLQRFLLELIGAADWEYITLPHLFRSDSGQSNRNFRNPVESNELFFTYILHCMKQFRPELLFNLDLESPESDRTHNHPE